MGTRAGNLDAEDQALTLPAGTVVAGDNIFAIQVHATWITNFISSATFTLRNSARTLISASAQCKVLPGYNEASGQVRIFFGSLLRITSLTCLSGLRYCVQLQCRPLSSSLLLAHAHEWQHSRGLELDRDLQRWCFCGLSRWLFAHSL
jgi:hypothetical protein